MSSNTIFSDKNSNYNVHFLHDEIEKVLVDLNKCLDSTKRVAEKSPSPNFQKGFVCLNNLYGKIYEKESELMFKQTLHYR